jgi:hypothetical protein
LATSALLPRQKPKMILVLPLKLRPKLLCARNFVYSLFFVCNVKIPGMIYCRSDALAANVAVNAHGMQ